MHNRRKQAKLVCILSWTCPTRFFNQYAFPGNGGKNACWHFLASLPNMEIESIPGNGTRNICWQYLATSLINSNATRLGLDSSLTILDIYPQAHGAIIVAFHPKVFRVSLFIFSKGMHLIKTLVWIWTWVIMLASTPMFIIGVRTVISR